MLGSTLKHLIILILAAMLSSPIIIQSAQAQEKPAKRPWTLLVYGAADNNADGPILSFLHSVRKALDDDPGMELLIFLDRAEGYSDDSKILGEEFTGTRLYRLHKKSTERLAGGTHFPEITLDSDVELDSADASNLGRFIAWGKATAPADRYALMIYSHANGQTMCPDEQSKRDMYIPEMTDEIGAEGHVDFLALELCTMGGIEVAYQWRPDTGRFGADVLLAIPNAGPPLDWARAFKRIRSPGHESTATGSLVNPNNMTAADFGKLVIEEGLTGRREHQANSLGGGGDYEAAACYDLRESQGVKERLDRLSEVLAKSDAKDEVLRLRNEAINYSDGGPYVDLFDLCRRLSGSEKLPAEVRKAASDCADQADRMILASFGMNGYAGFEAGRHGMFVVFPNRNWDRFGWYTSQKGSGDHYGRWAFLTDSNTGSRAKVDTWWELLDSWQR